MAAAQCLKATHVVHDGVISVDNHVQQVDDRVQGVGSDVQQVGIHVQRVDDKVQDVGSDVRQVDIRVEQVDGKVEGVSSDVQQVDIHVQQVDDKVQGVDDKVQQVADNIGDQKRSSSNNLNSLAMKAQLLSQGISYERTSETGSLPQIHLLIITLQPMLATKALPYGSSDVTLSRIGRCLIHCCGFTENVRPLHPLLCSG